MTSETRSGVNAVSVFGQGPRPVMRKVAFGYTTRCNARCAHCVAGEEPGSGRTMAFDTARRAVRELAAAGVGGISFSAGEPMLYIDPMLALVRLCRQAGLDYFVSFVTDFSPADDECEGFLRDRLLFLAAVLWIAGSADATEKYVYERLWPAISQPWYFHNPDGITIDEDGYVYVVDSGNDRVVKYNVDGMFVTQWGGPVQEKTSSKILKESPLIRTAFFISPIQGVTAS